MKLKIAGEIKVSLTSKMEQRSSSEMFNERIMLQGIKPQKQC
jgi:hypothetical protein